MRFLILLLLSSSLWASERPNIIFIFSDDWGWQDLSCHGHPYVKTPNIDRLAQEGRDFHRFTVASPVCSPSRVALMTGHFPARYHIDGHFAWVPDNKRRGMPDWLNTRALTLPRLLQEAGYSTGHFGKWHLSNNMIPDAPPASDYGYDAFGTFNNSGEQMPYDHDVTLAIKFIQESINEAKKPFFLNLWIHEPHTPFHVLPKFRQKFPEIKDEGDNIYAATLAYADERIGQLLDYLDQQKLTENTIVIFSSDNGPARSNSKKLELTYDSATGAGFGLGAAKGMTGGRKGYKASLHEGGLNVPFLIRWPAKIPAGTEDKDSFISAVDILPTLVNISGATLPESYLSDGIDQTKVLLGEPTKERTKPLFTRYFPKTNKQPEHWAQYTVLSGSYKLLSTPKKDRTELYNLTEDPLEKNNLFEQEPEQVKKMQVMLNEWLKTLPSKPSGNVFSKLRKP